MAEVYQGSDPYVFVSYAHKDDEDVLPVIEGLQAAGYRVWFDAGIESGYEFPAYIARHVDRCHCMVAFLSRNSAESPFCDREIYRAFKTRKEILPVYLDDSRPNAGTELLLDLNQSLFRSKFATLEALVERLIREPILEPCLREEVKLKQEAIELARVALSSSSESGEGLAEALSALSGLAVQDQDVARFTILIENRQKTLQAERSLRDALHALRALQDADEGVSQQANQLESSLRALVAERKRFGQEERKRQKTERAQRAEETRKEEEAREDAENKRQERAQKDIEESKSDWVTRASVAGRMEELAEDKALPRVFISYSWTSKSYQRAVVNLAERLVGDGVDVVIDVWDLKPGQDKYAFMERCVTDPTIDKVLILSDQAYADKADERRGGVGDETAVITSEVYGSARQEKFIPVLMERGKGGEEFLPVYLKSRMYVDLSDSAHEMQYGNLLRDIVGVPQWVKPKIGSLPSWLYVGQTTEAKEPERPNEVLVKNLAEYSWMELKLIADKIAGARSDDEGLEVARRYNLVGADGRLGDERMPVALTDGRKAEVRIAGFRHDELAGGGGRKAGITFEFADIPVRHAMNPSSTNAGGWKGSEMHGYLNGEFLGLLPEELRSSIATVRKLANNEGGNVHNDASVVSATEDRLWLLSMSEVYGRLSGQKGNMPTYPAVYDAEGHQYKLYRDQGVSTSSYGFCEKKEDGASSWWWLRSPYAYGSYSFYHVVDSVGDWDGDYADGGLGVSPGFCF